MIRRLLFSLTWSIITIFTGTICAPLALISCSYRTKIVRFWCHTTLKLAKIITKFDFEVKGQFPTGPCLIAARHESLFETLALTILLDNPVFIMKREILFIPFIGCYAGADMIVVNRRYGVRALKHMIEQARSVIERGRPLVIFPEGTRSAPHHFPRLKSGIAALYEHLNLAITPVVVNSGLYWPPGFMGPCPGQALLDVMSPIPPGLSRTDVMARLAVSLEKGSQHLQRRAHITTFCEMPPT